MNQTKNVSTTHYGGAGVIGGNKILLEDPVKKVRIWLDYGLDFNRQGKFFSEFTQPRKSAGMTDLIRMGIIPKIQGLYRPDFVAKSGHKETHPLKFDAVVESHAHFDHIGCKSHLRPDMQIFTSPESYLVQRALQESGTGRFEDFIMYREYYKKPSDREEMLRPTTPVENMTTFKIKNMTIEAWRVDHSLPGAMAYIFHTSKGPVVYTGDFRLHGHHKEWTQTFIKRVAELKPYAVIGEGTNINETRGITENQVCERITNAVKKTKNLAIANWPVRDMDRLISFYRAAKENGRKLAITPKQFYILKLFWENHRDEALTINGKYLGHGKYEPVSPINKGVDAREIKTQYSPKLDDVLGKDIVVFIPRKKNGSIMDDSTLEEKMKDYPGWQREILAENLADESHPIPLDTTYRKKKDSKEKFSVRANMWVNADTIRNNQKDYVIFLDNFSIQEMIDLRPKKGSTYIYSKTEPFDAEMELDYDKVEAWCKEFELPIIKAHCSGHVGGSQAIRVYTEMAPKIFIPIHTEHPDSFKKLENKGIKVIIPNSQYPLEARQPIIF
ncbi:MAG: hypothetical protein KKB65_07225 [Nanoarchaeota archaeon]|nr:hypothetical protein [Nanoarchaeota archaeon]MBU1030998.1 hypothetical protein [Nanoarchaeota archaeon]MBU1850733.1 hypothetical protein [Nanoarchaeota archaeon]